MLTKEWGSTLLKPIEKIRFYIDLYSFCQKRKKDKSTETEQFSSECIPKIIHYCWFGRGKYSPLIEKCMKSWQDILPEYEFVLWNEENFPFEQYPFALEAYDKKKYAFVADVARLHALYENGGIYLDTDTEILKPLDSFLNHGAFSGYESYGGMNKRIQMGLVGAKKQHTWIKLLLSWYEGKHVAGYHLFTPNTRLISKVTEHYYGVKLDGKPLILENDVHIYASTYFSPGGKITEKTHCIHHFAGSWANN